MKTRTIKKRAQKRKPKELKRYMTSQNKDVQTLNANKEEEV